MELNVNFEHSSFSLFPLKEVELAYLKDTTCYFANILQSSKDDILSTQYSTAFRKQNPLP